MPRLFSRYARAQEALIICHRVLLDAQWTKFALLATASEHDLEAVRRWAPCVTHFTTGETRESGQPLAATFQCANATDQIMINSRRVLAGGNIHITFTQH
jgi:hypothetical protein